MTTQRIISGQATDDRDEAFNLSLRPTRLDDYVGQPKLVERLRITLAAVKQRGEPMEHVLLHGPPGLGKTTLAHIIAHEMGSHLVVTSGPALTRPTDLVGTLTKLQGRDVLFIDEIHRLPPVVEEYIYPAMEDFKIDVTVDSGMHAKIVTLPLKPFCLIGATTRAGLLSGPMRSRFGITHNLDFYNEQDLLTILHRSARLMDIGGPESGGRSQEPGGVGTSVPMSSAPTSDQAGPKAPRKRGRGLGGPGAQEAGVGDTHPDQKSEIRDQGSELDSCLRAIARRCRGTPRIANRLLRRVRDFAQVKADGRVTLVVIDQALKLEGVDEQGLDELDRKYFKVIGDVYRGGPVGLEAIAATLSEDAGTLEDVVEPYLLQIGFLARTRKGRQLTQRGAQHMGLKLPETSETSPGGLFDAEEG